MDKRNTLKSYGIDGSELSRLDGRVGERIAIYELMRADSDRYGVGFQVRYHVVSTEEGSELLEQGLRAVTFAKPLVRDFFRIIGDSRAPFEINPPLMVDLVAEGPTFKMVDV